jgi:uncharacterized membrane protein
MNELEQVLTDLAKMRCRITMFPIKKTGTYQVNVGTVTGAGWICEADADPLQALIKAGRARLRVDYVAVPETPSEG